MYAGVVHYCREVLYIWTTCALVLYMTASQYKGKYLCGVPRKTAEVKDTLCEHP